MRKSDEPIVPKKRPNKAGDQAAEAVEGEGSAKGNARERNTHRTQSRSGVPSGLERVRQAAKRDKKKQFTALLHHITVEALEQSYRRLNQHSSPGVDGVTWQEYGLDLERNLEDLHARVHRGSYRARPSRRVYIPKADGRQRPLGLATLEDKIVQGAVVRLLEAIYEADFMGFSYGFRPGRSTHNALDTLATVIQRGKVNWVLDADIRGFFDAIDHEWMMKFLEHRIQDRRLLRLIRKWLNAGVMEAGVWSPGVKGTPQGASISPLLANVYLHYALDLWAHGWRKKRTKGFVAIVRYADDFVMGFQHRTDAVSFRRDLEPRLKRFGLELHPDKTRLLEFGRFAAKDRKDRGEGKPETFAFLGFTHVCGRSRQGHFQLQRRTIPQRMQATLQAIKRELLRRMHEPIAEQGKWLRRVVQGYERYFAVPTNLRAISRFRDRVLRLWLKILRRRGDRRKLTWRRFKEYADAWLPTIRILHPWPTERFDARTRGRSPVR